MLCELAFLWVLSNLNYVLILKKLLLKKLTLASMSFQL